MSVISTGIKTCCFPIRQSLKALGFGPGEFEDFRGGDLVRGMEIWSNWRKLY
jgi:hypothetical protein